MTTPNTRPTTAADTRIDGGVRPTTETVLVPGLTIVGHPDRSRIGERYALTALVAGREEKLGRVDPAFSPVGGGGLRPLADLYLSRRPIFLVPGTNPGGVRIELRDGGTALEVDGRPVTSEVEIPAADIARGAVLLLAHRVVLVLSRMDPQGSSTGAPGGLIGSSVAMDRLRREIRRVAHLSVPVLLTGPTGSGKELVASAVHAGSPRAGRPFVAVDMGALPASLAAAELFGSVRGAFTGADRPRPGLFRRAEGGTLLLDEIGEASPDVQVLLLRALEASEIRAVGSDELQPVNVRVIAATDRDLTADAAAGRFRAPLLHRLAGYEIRVPALAERREDFGELFHHFFDQELAALGAPERPTAPEVEERPLVPAAVLARLVAHSWPGNVRELRNAARRLAVVGHDSGDAALWQETDQLLASAPTTPPPAVDGAGINFAPRPVENRPARVRYRDAAAISDEEVLSVLRAERWRIQRAARVLGVSRTSLYARMDAIPGIRKAADLSRAEIEGCLKRHRGDLAAMAEELEVSERSLIRCLRDLGLN